jgi:pimeloyl-ACP methyl ester carboxylesterase
VRRSPAQLDLGGVAAQLVLDQSWLVQLLSSEKTTRREPTARKRRHLRDVIVVANDTGGAITQLLVVQHPERIARIVPSDSFECFFRRRSLCCQPPPGYRVRCGCLSSFCALGRCTVYRSPSVG